MKPTLTAWQQLLQEADLCADYARDADQCGRYCAACGLILTASALCNRALESAEARCEVEAEVMGRLGFYQDEVDRLLEKSIARRLNQTDGRPYVV